MSRLTDLIAKAKANDPQLGADLEREFRALSSRLSFGLNFERHRPEAVELPQRPVRRGDKVRVLPPRGSTAKGDQRLWQVKKIVKDGNKKKRAELELPRRIRRANHGTTWTILVVVAEFRDTIYPGLVSTGKVSRGGDKPWHTVINGENYHVLKALTWTHRGKVDAIYIDPPYNSGAKDWKYNNDYVEPRGPVSPQQVAGYDGAALAAGEGVVESGGFSADRHDRREGISAAWPAAGAAIPRSTNTDDQSLPLTRKGRHEGRSSTVSMNTYSSSPLVGRWYKIF